MWYWYYRRPAEILIDLDKANVKRVRAFTSRLVGAVEVGVLDVVDWFLVPSSTEENVHAVIRCGEDISALEHAAWECYLISDRFRAACNAMRAAHGIPRPVLLIEPYPVPGWREPDAVCECAGKHDPTIMGDCPVSKELHRPESSAHFGTPRVVGWEKALRRATWPGNKTID